MASPSLQSTQCGAGIQAERMQLSPACHDRAWELCVRSSSRFPAHEKFMRVLAYCLLLSRWILVLSETTPNPPCHPEMKKTGAPSGLVDAQDPTCAIKFPNALLVWPWANRPLPFGLSIFSPPIVLLVYSLFLCRGRYCQRFVFNDSLKEQNFRLISTCVLFFITVVEMLILLSFLSKLLDCFGFFFHFQSWNWSSQF